MKCLSRLRLHAGAACLVGSALFLCGGLAPLFGQIVAWDVHGTAASTANPMPATLLDPGIASATLTLGIGVTASSASNTFGGSGFDQRSLSAAMAANDYLSFTVVPTAGRSLSLTSISLLFGVSSAVTSFHVALATSATGFSVPELLWTFAFNTTLSPSQSISLVDYVELQDVTSALEIRLHGWRDPSGSSTFRIRDNAGYDLAIFGTVSEVAAIPEPSAYAAGIAALVAGAVMARRGRSWRPRRVSAAGSQWSGRQDSNLRPPGPKPGALPG